MKIISVYLDDEMYNFIKSETNNVSKHITKLIKKEMETKEDKIKRLKDEITIKEQEIKDIEESKVKDVKAKEDKIKNLTKEQKEELILSFNILNKQGGNIYFDGRYNRYKNLFGFISKEDFKELLKLLNIHK